MLRISLLLCLFLSTVSLKSQFSNEKIFVEDSEVHGNTFKEVISVDFDFDGDLDLIIATDRAIIWFENNLNYEFLEAKLLFMGRSIESIRAINVDQDLDIDLIIGFGGSVVLYKNDGNGNFSESQVLGRIQLTGFQVFSGVQLMLGDIDKDGLTDIIYNDSVRDVVVWNKNNGNGFFSEEKLVFDNVNNKEFGRPKYNIGDLENDGDLDVVIGYENGTGNKESLSWYKNESGIGFSDELVIADNIASLSNHERIYIEDMNGDGYMDIVTSQNGNIDWYINNGASGRFSYQTLVSHNKSIGPLLISDLDGDNDMDIVYTHYDSIVGNGANLVWKENIGNGFFSKNRLIASKLTDYPNSLYSLDINLDGRKDIAATYSHFSTGYDAIAFYENYIGFPTVEGKIFWDRNQNQIFDDIDSPINNLPVEVTPNPLGTFSDSNGNFRLYLDNGEYVLSVSLNSCWNLPAEYLNQSVNVEGGQSQKIIFPLEQISPASSSNISIHSDQTRCGFNIPFRVTVENDGCDVVNGRVSLILSELTSIVDLSTDLVAIVEDTVFWTFEGLESSKTITLSIPLEVAGVDFIGQYINLSAILFTEDESGNLALSNTFDYSSQIRCAYDPNDKLVHPNRLQQYSENYTLFEESMEYTIRFQNTGNDTAFTVVLRDTLDKNLDWATFKPITASHPYETFLNSKDGAVEFSFRDILLPDSTTNEPLSHGFVTYKISPKQGLSENTIIENTANIYFDFNPPIITNTTQNVMVSELPKTTPTYDLTIKQEVKVYPNPFGDFLTIERELLSNEVPMLSIFDVTGRELKTTNLQGSYQQISTFSFAKGLYFYQVSNADGQMIANGKLVKQ